MISFRLYNKKSNRLDYRCKLLYSTNHPDEAIQQFVEGLDDRIRSVYAQYSAIAKDGKLIAREARYLGV